jgi:PIN domain nuclease of toxin-antitoxin system
LNSTCFTASRSASRQSASSIRGFRPLNLLLDTHIFLWAAAEPLRLEPRIREVIVSFENQVLVSAVTAWEIAIKQGAGRLNFPLDRFDAAIDAMGCAILPILAGHALAVARLPRHHVDPFDRMLISQALVEGLTLVTRDRAIMQYGTADR